MLERRRAFYERLYDLAERHRAFKLARQLRAAVDRYLLLLRAVEEPMTHLGLLSYLEAEDVEGVKRWLADHLAKVSSQLQHIVIKADSTNAGE